ncbi:MAG: hypothetical protein ACKOCV_07320, partial [Gemmatimonadota bacterium]
MQLVIRGGVVSAMLFAGACRPTPIVTTSAPSTPPAPVSPNLNGPWEMDIGQSVAYKIAVDVSIVARYTDSSIVSRPTYDTSSTVAMIAWSNRTATGWDGQLRSFATGIRSGPLVPVAGVRFPVTLTFSARAPDGPWVRTAPRET